MNKGHIHAIGFWIAVILVFLCLFWAYTHGYKADLIAAAHLVFGMVKQGIIVVLCVCFVCLMLYLI